MPFTRIKTTLFTSLLIVASLQVNAHEVWLERDDNGPVRVYLGEPGEPETGSEIDKLAGSEVFTNNREVIAPINQENDHWQAKTNGGGDVRLFSDKVWEPWEMDGPSWWEFWKDSSIKLQAAILQARVGRTETSAILSYELVPTKADGNIFTATFEGKPIANKSVFLLSPSKKEHEFTTNDQGQIEIKNQESGRFILSSVHTVDTEAMHSGKQVASLMYISTLSYVVL
jgi:uncharacterized GH25 family protein